LSFGIVVVAVEMKDRGKFPIPFRARADAPSVEWHVVDG
jgi:hypothetical protein